MKRFASLTALLLTLVLVLSLAACGDKNTADDNQTTDQPSTTQPADTGDAAQTNGTTTGSVDLAALRDQLIADCGYTDTLPVETAGLESTYGITADQVTSSASFNATVGTAFPDEIVMVEATDAAAAQDVASKLTNRLSAIADQLPMTPTAKPWPKSARSSPAATMWACSSLPTMTRWCLPSRTLWANETWRSDQRE